MSEATVNSEAVWQALASIPDPEFGIDIVDLGLIYSVECRGAEVHVVMTLTTPTCPSGAWIHAGVQRALADLPGVQRAEVSLVFDPPWSPELLSPDARQALGR